MHWAAWVYLMLEQTAHCPNSYNFMMVSPEVTFALARNFYIQHQKHDLWNKKLVSLAWFKLKYSGLWKPLLKEWKYNLQPGRNILKNTYMIKDFCVQTMKKHLKLRNKKIYSPIQNRQNIWINISPKKICIC